MIYSAIIFVMLMIAFIIGLSYFLSDVARQDTCAGTLSAFKGWCDICSIRDWPASNGVTGTVSSCIKQTYNKSVSTCNLAREACSALAGVK